MPHYHAQASKGGTGRGGGEGGGTLQQLGQQQQGCKACPSASEGRRPCPAAGQRAGTDGRRQARVAADPRMCPRMPASVFCFPAPCACARDQPPCQPPRHVVPVPCAVCAGGHRGHQAHPGGLLQVRQPPAAQVHVAGPLPVQVGRVQGCAACAGGLAGHWSARSRRAAAASGRTGQRGAQGRMHRVARFDAGMQTRVPSGALPPFQPTPFSLRTLSWVFRTPAPHLASQSTAAHPHPPTSFLRRRYAAPDTPGSGIYWFRK